jgi:hypothetical protein
MKILTVTPKEHGFLHIKLDDGSSGLFDVKPYFESEVFEPLKEFTEFKNIKNGGYYVEWACGADLSLDTIAARWSKIMQSTTNHC